MHPAPSNPQAPLGRHSRRVISLLRKIMRPDERVLDAGAGESPYRPYLTGRIVGLDVTFAPAIQVCGSLEALPFADSTFDGVLCFQVLYYAPSPENWIREIARVLRPGGWFGMSVSRPKAIGNERRRSGRDLCSWSPKEWNRRIAAAGFRCKTPWSETFLRSRMGAYSFGLYRRQA